MARSIFVGNLRVKYCQLFVWRSDIEKLCHDSHAGAVQSAWALLQGPHIAWDKTGYRLSWFHPCTDLFPSVARCSVKTFISGKKVIRLAELSLSRGSVVYIVATRITLSVAVEIVVSEFPPLPHPSTADKAEVFCRRPWYSWPTAASTE